MASSRILAFVVFVAAAFSTAAPAAHANQITHAERLCPAPIAVCAPGFPECPNGSACTCVPSCPACDDCATFVCVPHQSRECRTACDCPTSLGCFESRCIAGFAPVYCCDEGQCPLGEQCQARDGAMSTCDESSCEKRLRDVQSSIDSLLERHNGCRRDAQCVDVSTRTECDGPCGVAVRRGARTRFEQRLRRIDQRICTGYQEDGCPYVDYECVPPQPVCREGRCERG